LLSFTLLKKYTPPATSAKQSKTLGTVRSLCFLSWASVFSNVGSATVSYFLVGDSERGSVELFFLSNLLILSSLAFFISSKLAF